MREFFNQINLVCWSEVKQVKGWLAQQWLTKLVVLLGFGFLAVMVAGFVWLWSWGYMSSLAVYENYGELTALYLIKAGFLIIAWLGVGSAITTNLTWVINKNAEMDYLLVLPLKEGVLAAWSLFKTVLMNWVLVLIAILPLIGAYFVAFIPEMADVGLAGRVVVIGLVLAMLVTALGSMLTYLTANYWVRINRAVGVIGVLVFFGVSTWLMLKAVFPEELKLLYMAEPERFVEIYASLPLLTAWWPSVWLAGMMYGLKTSWWVVVLAGGLLIVAWMIEKRMVIRLRQLAKEKEDRRKRYGFHLVRSGGLVKKDLISVIRTPTEWGYGVLLMGMAVIFFALLRQATADGYWSRKFEAELLVAALGWLLFFATAFGLRVLFPLMAREGKMGWWLMSLPLRAKQMVGNKIKAGVVLGLPLLAVTTLVWLQVPFQQTELLWILLFTGTMALTLMLLLVLWGMIAPIFRLADQPDKVSTSLPGLAALAVSLMIIVWSTVTAGGVFGGEQTEYKTIWVGVLLGLAVVTASYLLALKMVKKYEF